MKNNKYLHMKGILIFLFSFLSFFLICAQNESNQKIIISEDKTDDLYISGENIDINATVFGDLIAAGGTITIHDFSKAAIQLNRSIVKNLGYGFLYLFGLPFLIVLTFIIITGIPIGIILLFIYILSLFLGNLIAALLLTHYLNQRNAVSWNFWIISFIALLITILLHILTFIPILGFINSLFIIALSYGALISPLLPERIK